MPVRPTGHRVLNAQDADWVRPGWVALPEEDYGEQLHFILDLESALQRCGGTR